jgi:hypothetical protein
VDLLLKQSVESLKLEKNTILQKKNCQIDCYIAEIPIYLFAYVVDSKNAVLR